jgi:CheY-like chemotaxis protein
MVKRILAIVPDLLIETRIEAAARAVDATVETVTAQEATERMGSSSPALVIVDLGAPGLDLEAIASAARQWKVRLAGFYPHVDVALRRAAKGAGVDHVYPRSRFLRELPAILRERLQD